MDEQEQVITSNIYGVFKNRFEFAFIDISRFQLSTILNSDN